MNAENISPYSNCFCFLNLQKLSFNDLFRPDSIYNNIINRMRLHYMFLDLQDNIAFCMAAARQITVLCIPSLSYTYLSLSQTAFQF